MKSSDDQLTLMKVRQLNGLTQKEVADLLGVTVQTVSNWERGTQVPRLTFEQTKRLMDALELTIDDLVAAFQGTQLERASKGGEANVKT